jgi:hypothetical protein
MYGKPVTFGNLKITLTCSSVFLAEILPTGTVKNVTYPGCGWTRDLAIAATGDAYSVGSIFPGATPFGSITLTSAGSQDILVWKQRLH